MSVTILLIPVALAAASLVGGTGLTAALKARAEGRGSGEDGGTTLSVRTRMKDRGLLGLALEDIGAVDVEVGDGRVTALVDDLRLSMTLTDDGVWEAHIDRENGFDVDESAATDLLARIDGAYAGRVQSAVAARIRAQADSAGFELVSETRDDEATVTMVLNVRNDA